MDKNKKNDGKGPPCGMVGKVVGCVKFGWELGVSRGKGEERTRGTPPPPHVNCLGES